MAYVFGDCNATVSKICNCKGFDRCSNCIFSNNISSSTDKIMYVLKNINTSINELNKRIDTVQEDIRFIKEAIQYSPDNKELMNELKSDFKSLTKLK